MPIFTVIMIYFIITLCLPSHSLRQTNLKVETLQFLPIYMISMGDFAIKHMAYPMVRSKYRMFLVKILSRILVLHLFLKHPFKSWVFSHINPGFCGFFFPWFFPHQSWFFSRCCSKSCSKIQADHLLLPIRHHLFALQELLGRLVQASPVTMSTGQWYGGVFTPVMLESQL